MVEGDRQALVDKQGNLVREDQVDILGWQERQGVVVWLDSKGHLGKQATVIHTLRIGTCEVGVGETSAHHPNPLAVSS